MSWIVIFIVLLVSDYLSTQNNLTTWSKQLPDSPLALVTYELYVLHNQF